MVITDASSPQVVYAGVSFDYKLKINELLATQLENNVTYAKCGFATHNRTVIQVFSNPDERGTTGTGSSGTEADRRNPSHRTREVPGQPKPEKPESPTPENSGQPDSEVTNQQKPGTTKPEPEYWTVGNCKPTGRNSGNRRSPVSRTRNSDY